MTASEKREQRMYRVAFYIVENQSTIRETAKYYGIGKSTVWNDIQRLGEFDLILYLQVDAVLKTNLAERHIRGGEATRKKFLTAKAG